MRQWAITVGINQYQSFQPLSYAQQDAQAVRNFLVDEAGFESDHCLLLTDTSPPVWGNPTYPNRENIQGWVDLLTQQYLQPGDLLWYFFSGYGACYHGQDYLVPIEGDPTAISTTGVPLEPIFARFKAVPTQNVLVLLDMNRSQGSVSNESVGAQTVNLASYTGISTILSCKPGQFSREAATLGHGFFTAALLDSLRSSPGATLENLHQYLSDRLPELSEHHWRPTQQPLTVSSPEKIHQIILPHTDELAAVSAYAPPGSQTSVISNGQWQSPGSSSSSMPFGTQSNGSFSSTQASTNGQVATQPTNNMASQSNGHPSTPSNGYSVLGNTTSPPTAEGSSTEDIPDSQFWRLVMLWGGIAIAVLFLGVLLKNWGSIVQGSQVPSPSSSATGGANSKTPGKPKPSDPSATNKAPVVAPSNQPTDNSNSQSSANSKDPASPTSKPSPGSSISSPPNTLTPIAPMNAQTGKLPSGGQLSLEQARSMVKGDQASPYWYAILEANKILPEQPQYKEAQQDIAVWSREIFNVAKDRAAQKNFDTAILAAVLVPLDQPFYGEVRNAINQWCPSVYQQPVKNPALQKQAKELCQRLLGR